MAATTVAPPHFVTATGTDILPLDSAQDAQPTIGSHLYIPTPTFNLVDTGVPGNAGYSVGIVNNITIRVTALVRLMQLVVGKDARDGSADSLIKNVYIDPILQRVLALETRSDSQANTLADTLSQTQSTVDTEITRVKTVVTDEFNKTEQLKR
jgi:hypothetical protein